MLNPSVNSTLKSRLPWDNQQLRITDALALVLALIAMLLVVFIKLPPLPKAKLIPDNFNQIDRTILIPPPVVEAPKPKQAEVPKEDKKAVVKAEPKPKEVYKPKLDEAKAIPKAAQPTKADEVAKSKPRGSESASPPARTEGTPASKEGSSGEVNPKGASNSAAGAAQAAARESAVRAVQDTGLANALQGLDTFEAGASSADQYSGKAPTNGGRTVTRNNAGGNGTGGGEGAGTGSSKGKGGKTFGSATGSDGTGTKGSGLDARSTKGVGSGSEIKDKSGHGAMNIEAKADKADGGKRTDVDRVMSQAKGRAQQAFKRALDDDPTLGGKVSVRIKISPSGSVTSATIASSDLNNPALEGKILAIIKGLSFASGNFDVYEGKYDFNFVGQ